MNSGKKWGCSKVDEFQSDVHRIISRFVYLLVYYMALINKWGGLGVMHALKNGFKVGGFRCHACP